MSDYLESLPELPFEKVSTYCTVDDLRNLSCCCKSLNDKVKRCGMPFSTVRRIPWECLYKKDFIHACKEQLDNLDFVKSLHIGTHKAHEKGRINIDINREKNQDVILANYYQVLKKCDSEILQVLSINELHINVDCFKRTYQLLPNLQSLTISGMKLLDASALRSIVEFRNIIELNFERTGNHIDDDILHALCQSLGKLTSLKIDYARVSDQGILHLLNLKFLEELSIYSNEVITDSGFLHLSELITLKKLTAGNCTKLTHVGISHLHKLPLLEVFNLCNSNGLRDEAAFQLSKLLTLKQLSVTGTNISDDGMKDLSTLKHLAELHIVHTNISDACIPYLNKLTLLRKLDLGSNPITDDGLFYLHPFSKLQELSMHQCQRVTDSGISHLAKIPSLKILDIRATKGTSEGLKCLTSLVQLNTLKCSEHLITDATQSLFHNVQMKY